MEQEAAASTTQMLGAGGFGALIGWYIYMINRYRKSEVQSTDLVTLIGVIGGSAILNIFKPGTDLFGAYGIGLFCGFFGYFVVLVLLVAISKNFNFDWFLDGRRRLPDGSVQLPEHGSASGGVAMAIDESKGGNF